MTLEYYKMADFFSKPLDSGNTFFDISVNTGQICMAFGADTPEKNNRPIVRPYKDQLVRKLLTSIRKIRLLTNKILTRCLSESR